MSSTPSRQYRKRPVVIEAVQWLTLGDHQNVTRSWSASSDFRCPKCGQAWGKHGEITTLESKPDGAHHVCPGDWIITGVKGEHYACKPDIFAATYEIVSDKPSERGKPYPWCEKTGHACEDTHLCHFPDCQERQAHNDHPARHFDRTCPACLEESAASVAEDASECIVALKAATEEAEMWKRMALENQAKFEQASNALSASGTWIEVGTSDVPVEGNHVLVFSLWDKCVYTAYTQDGRWLHANGDGSDKYVIRNVTHWQDVPCAPDRGASK